MPLKRHGRRAPMAWSSYLCPRFLFGKQRRRVRAESQRSKRNRVGESLDPVRKSGVWQTEVY
jgi:hypothetical protein